MSAMAFQIISLTIVLLNRLFRGRSKKTSKFHVTGLCAGNSPVIGEFSAQMAVNADFFSFDDVIMNWLCIHVILLHIFIGIVVLELTES